MKFYRNPKIYGKQNLQWLSSGLRKDKVNTEPETDRKTSKYWESQKYTPQQLWHLNFHFPASHYFVHFLFGSLDQLSDN